MRRNLMLAGACLLSLGLLSPWALADPLTAPAEPLNTDTDEVVQLKQMLRNMQDSVRQMQQDIEVLKTRLATTAPPAVPAPTTAEQKMLTERVETLESTVAASEESQDSLLKRLDTMTDLNVYTALEVSKFNNKSLLFDARNVELLLDMHPYDRLRSRVQIRLERLASIDNTDAARLGEIEVHQGWLEYAINEYFNPRAGVILVPFGKYNLESFDPFQEQTLRPLSNLRVVPSTWSDVGLGFAGSAALGEAWKLPPLFKDTQADYQFFFTQGLTNDIRDHRGLRDARASYQRDNNQNKAMVGRLGLRPTSNLELGLSGYHGIYDSKGHDITGVDVDSKVTLGPFDLLGEYAFFGLQEGGRRGDSSVSPITDTTAIVPNSLGGGYVEAHYHFWFDWLNNTFLGRKFPNPSMTASLRFDKIGISDDSDSGSGRNDESRWTVGLNYRPVPTWVLKFDYVFWDNTKTETLDPTTTGAETGFIASLAAAF